MTKNLLACALFLGMGVAAVSCGDVGGDPTNDAGTSGGTAGKGGSAGGGPAGGGQGGSTNDAAAGADAGRDASVDVASDARLDGNAGNTDARQDGSGGAAGAGGAVGSGGAGGASGTGGASGSGGAGGSAGATGGAAGAGTGGTTTDGGDASGGTGGTSGSDGGEDAPPDAPENDGRPMIEGGRDATTTTTSVILAAAGADCLACLEANGPSLPECDLANVRCELFPDIAQQLNCLDTLACALPSGAAKSCALVDVDSDFVNLTPCYCGTVPTGNCTSGNIPSGTSYGVCKGFIDVGFPGKSQSFVAANIANAAFSSGRAMKIAQCAGDFATAGDDLRCAACFARLNDGGSNPGVDAGSDAGADSGADTSLR
ncbi:MAG: hypothetical protein ABW133_10665 [Polyangiaceae bacterium]